MEPNRSDDPMATLFAVPESPASDQTVKKVVQQARRQVGTHDVMGLMLVNLWRVVAQLLTPIFLMGQRPAKHELKENNNEQS